MSTVRTTCPRCESRLELGDLRCPVCFHTAPTTAEDHDAVRVEILRCSGCGAAVSYDVRVGAPRCAFCGSETTVEVPEDPLEQTEQYLPFTVGRDEARSSFRSWLGSLGWFRPGDLKSESTIESLQPLWWVGWTCSAEALVSWTADSDAGARRADWAPHSGQTEMPLDHFVVSASRGLSTEETAALAASYDYGSTREAAETDHSGAVVEQFDVLRSAARRQVRGMIDGHVARRLQDGVIPGRRFRNLHTALLLRRLVTRRVAFPSYVVAYRYRGRPYRVVVSGQDVGCLLGSAPYSLARILLAVAGGILGLAALAVLVALVL